MVHIAPRWLKSTFQKIEFVPMKAIITVHRHVDREKNNCRKQW